MEGQLKNKKPKRRLMLEAERESLFSEILKTYKPKLEAPIIQYTVKGVDQVPDSVLQSTNQIEQLRFFFSFKIMLSPFCECHIRKIARFF